MYASELGKPLCISNPHWKKKIKEDKEGRDNPAILWWLYCATSSEVLILSETLIPLSLQHFCMKVALSVSWDCIMIPAGLLRACSKPVSWGKQGCLISSFKTLSVTPGVSLAFRYLDVTSWRNFNVFCILHMLICQQLQLYWLAMQRLLNKNENQFSFNK